MISHKDDTIDVEVSTARDKVLIFEPDLVGCESMLVHRVEESRKTSESFDDADVEVSVDEIGSRDEPLRLCVSWWFGHDVALGQFVGEGDGWGE